MFWNASPGVGLYVRVHIVSAGIGTWPHGRGGSGRADIIRNRKTKSPGFQPISTLRPDTARHVYAPNFADRSRRVTASEHAGEVKAEQTWHGQYAVVTCSAQ